MATDQNQSRMKPRIWLATGSRAKLGADRSPQERPGGLTGQGMSLTGPVRSAGSSGLTQGWLPWGAQSSQASCCLSQSSVHLKCWSLTYKSLQIVFSKEKPESVGSIKNEGSKWKEYWTWTHGPRNLLHWLNFATIDF